MIFNPLHKIISMNIIETIQQRLGYSTIEKVDPNTNQVKNEDVIGNTERLKHAAIASILAGFYKNTKSEQDANTLWSEKKPTDWTDVLFGEKTNEMIQKVAKFGYKANELAKNEMNKVGDVVMIVFLETTGEHNATTLKKFISNQRNNILPYLPLELELGNIFNDNTMDDRTNKMEGPVSGLMHAIEKAFSLPQEPKVIDERD